LLLRKKHSARSNHGWPDGSSQVDLLKKIFRWEKSFDEGPDRKTFEELRH